MTVWWHRVGFGNVYRQKPWTFLSGWSLSYRAKRRRSRIRYRLQWHWKCNEYIADNARIVFKPQVWWKGFKKWKNQPYEDTTGYDYIGAHLGYRYEISQTAFSYKMFGQTAQLTLSIKIPALHRHIMILRQNCGYVTWMEISYRLRIWMNSSQPQHYSRTAQLHSPVRCFCTSQRELIRFIWKWAVQRMVNKSVLLWRKNRRKTDTCVVPLYLSK